MKTTMRLPRPLAAALLALLALLAPVAPGQTTPEPLGPPDAWGYEMHDQTTGARPFSFVDLAGGGTLLSFPAPGDDEGASILPSRPFQLYGLAVPGFVVSTNGYLAATGSLAAEDGRDYSNDSIPSVPGYVPPVAGTPTTSFPGRLAAFHDDLALGSGSVRWQEYATCPRASGAVAAEACTVIQWSGVRQAGGAESMTFETILYHASFSVAFQLQASDATGGGSASVGIQDLEARRGLQYAANEAGRLPAGTAVCFFDPRHPAGGPRADLGLFDTSKLAPASAGDLVTYGVSVRNAGPSDATGVAVDAPFPAGLTWVTDSCGGAFVTGQWAPGDLPSGGSAECLVTARVGIAATGPITHTFTVRGLSADPEASNNALSVVLELLPPIDDGDGVPAATEDAYPGGGGSPAFAAGDGNGDGTPDSLQANVATLPMAAGGGWLSVELVGGPCNTLQNVGAISEAAVAALDPLYDFPVGLVSFRVPCVQGSASVTVWYHGAAGTPGTYRKYGPVLPGSSPAEWYTLQGVTFGRTRDVPTASFSLTDGQTGDDTGPDGVIVGQGGPGQSANDAAAIPAASPSGLALLAVMTLAAGGWALRRA